MTTEPDEPDLCACGRPWTDVPTGHSRAYGTDGSYTCADITAVPPADFLAWGPDLGVKP